MNLIERGSWLRLADDFMKLARTEDDLRMKIVGLKRLRDFTATVTPARGELPPPGAPTRLNLFAVTVPTVPHRGRPSHWRFRQ